MSHHHQPDPADPLVSELLAARPVPPARFRARGRRRLLALGPPAARPPHLWRLAAGYVVLGLLLLAVAVLSVAGIGPLGS